MYNSDIEIYGGLVTNAMYLCNMTVDCDIVMKVISNEKVLITSQECAIIMAFHDIVEKYIIREYCINNPYELLEDCCRIVGERTGQNKDVYFANADKVNKYNVTGMFYTVDTDESGILSKVSCMYHLISGLELVKEYSLSIAYLIAMILLYPTGYDISIISEEDVKALFKDWFEGRDDIFTFYNMLSKYDEVTD